MCCAVHLMQDILGGIASEFVISQKLQQSLQNVQVRLGAVPLWACVSRACVSRCKSQVHVKRLCQLERFEGATETELHPPETSGEGATATVALCNYFPLMLCCPLAVFRVSIRLQMMLAQLHSAVSWLASVYGMSKEESYNMADQAAGTDVAFFVFFFYFVLFFRPGGKGGGASILQFVLHTRGAVTL
jgi:hypothetical protein